MIRMYNQKWTILRITYDNLISWFRGFRKFVKAAYVSDMDDLLDGYRCRRPGIAEVNCNGGRRALVFSYDHFLR